MNSMFQRMYWKEIRSQWTTWLALAASILLLHLFLLIQFYGFGASFPSVAVGAVIVMTFCFVVASVALLFAGEEEHGTALFVRQLPVSTRCLFWSKVLATLTGTLSMLVGGALSMSIVLYLMGEQFPMVSSELIGFVFLGLVILTATLFWSLCCQNVFRVLLLSSTVLCPVMVLLYGRYEGEVSASAFIPVLICMGIVLPLSRRWHLGHLPGWFGQELFSVSTPCDSSSETSLWTRLLRHAATQSTELKRTCFVLLWREIRLAVPFALTVVVLTTLAVVTRVGVIPELPVAFLLLPLLVLECGLRSFRHDQQKLHGMFWSQRGVSPTLVWCIRSAVWLSLLLLLTAIAVAFDLARVDHAFENQHVRLIDIWRALGGFAETRGTPLLPVSATLASLIGGFFIAQLNGCWIRKPVVAFFVSVITVMAYAVFLTSMVDNDVPMILTAWPVTLTAAAAVVLTRRQWMDRRTSLRIWGGRFALITIPLVCLWPVITIWRATQVPDVGLQQNPLQGFVYSAENDDPNRTAKWEALQKAISPLDFGGGMQDIDVTLDDERLDPAVELILEFVTHESDFHLPQLSRVPWGNILAQPIARGMVQKARQRETESDPAAAMDLLTSAVKMMRLLKLECTSWSQFTECMDYELYLLQYVHKLAANPSLSAEELDRHATAMVSGIRYRVPESEFLHNRVRVYSSLLSDDGLLRNQYFALIAEPEKPGNIPHRWPGFLIESSASERQRFLRLMAYAGAARFAESLADPKRFSRWLATTPASGSDLDRFDLSDFSYHERRAQRNINAARATSLILRIQAFRRRHDRFPHDLIELRDRLSDSEQIALTTLPSGAFFQYFRNGIGTEYVTFENPSESSRVFIDGSQPIVCCPNFMVLQHESSRLHDDRDFKQLAANTARIVYLDGKPIPVPGAKVMKSSSPRN